MIAGDKILIVMAAGKVSRMGSSVPKQFMDLCGKPVLRRTIETFVRAVPEIRVITVLPKEHISFWREYCLSSEFTCPQFLVKGGFTRFHSVRNALERVPDGPCGRRRPRGFYGRISRSFPDLLRPNPADVPLPGHQGGIFAALRHIFHGRRFGGLEKRDTSLLPSRREVQFQTYLTGGS